ncbi:DASS family sodium-coupled anion symporter [candidate division KSB1 bacterium]|nr:DASS family sodium-coupled anion symporter [candidate division KSB1 bacterium]
MAEDSFQDKTEDATPKRLEKAREEGNVAKSVEFNSVVMLFAGPLLAAALGFGLFYGGSTAEVAWTAGITLICALWWIFEPIPIPATSLIPLAVLPLVGVLTPSQVGEAYGSPLILLLLGGFMLSTALARSGAHRRIALGMVHAFGGDSPRRLVFGFMAAATVLSMWISNTATTLMLLPIVLAITEKVTDSRMKVSLLLGVAFAANIGGLGTPIGTPPNLIFMKVYAENTGIEITFLGWMKWALPVVMIMVPITGIWLTRGLKKQVKLALPDAGTWRSEEIRTLIVFALTALLWMTRKEPFGGWSALAGLPTANDASVALLAVVAMFLIPNGRGSRLLVWDAAVKIPWGILILFGSGICIAKAFVSSGLSLTLGAALAGLGQLPLLPMILIICLSVTFLTEVTSNTATTTLLMPILAAAATNTGIDHALIMVPAAMSASLQSIIGAPVMARKF